MAKIKLGIVGCGVIGTRHIQAAAASPLMDLVAVADPIQERVHAKAAEFHVPGVFRDGMDLIKDPGVEAVVLALTTGLRGRLAAEAFKRGKHVLLEKPLAATTAEAQELIDLAERNKLTLMVDHTFIYTGAVRKMKEIVSSGELGDLLYFDSVRINLGLFQRDINVLWDLAPHDLSIMDFLIDRQPQAISALGSSHIERGVENIAYLVMLFPDEFIAHFHFNWLAPVKIRRTMIAGSSKMILYDDIEPTEKVRVYDKGVTANRVGNREVDYQTLVSYRTGDVWAPKLDSTEALRHVVAEFLDSIREGRKPLTDGYAGLRVVRLLEAAQQSIKSGGNAVILADNAQTAPA